jgi:hypothetical protein
MHSHPHRPLLQRRIYFYKLSRREIIQAMRLKEERFGIEPEMVSNIALVRCRVWECAKSYRPRTYEKGKKIGWKDGARALYCFSAQGASVKLWPI